MCESKPGYVEPKQVQAPEREEMLDEGQWEVLCDMALELGLPPIVYQIVRQAELARAEVGRLALKLDCANAQADLFAERLRSLHLRLVSAAVNAGCTNDEAANAIYPDVYEGNPDGS